MVQSQGHYPPTIRERDVIKYPPSGIELLFMIYTFRAYLSSIRIINNHKRVKISMINLSLTFIWL